MKSITKFRIVMFFLGLSMVIIMTQTYNYGLWYLLPLELAFGIFAVQLYGGLIIQSNGEHTNG